MAHKTKQQIKRLLRHKVFQSWSVSKRVLAILGETAGLIAFDPISIYLRRGKLEGFEESLRDKSVRNSLSYLEKKGYVKKVKQSGATLYRLTVTGSAEVEKLLIKFKYENAKWDGRWRFVVWDVPEDKKLLRDGLRNTLKFLGFRKLQGSVWVFPYDIFDDLGKLIPDIKKHHWIKLIESDRTVNDKDIYQMFFGKEKDDLKD